MSAINWLSGVNGNWRNGARWSSGAAPTAIDDVTAAAAGAYTISVTSADVADSLTFNAAGATLLETSAGALNIGGAVKLQAGTMSLAGANTIGAFSESGGVLQLSNAGALGANALSLTGGELSGMNTETIANHLLMGGAGFTIDAATGQAADFGAGGWLLDRSANAAIQFGSNARAGTVLWHGDNAGINGAGNYTVHVAGGALKAADGGVDFLLRNTNSTTIDAGASIDINGVSTSIFALGGDGDIVNSGGGATLKLSNAFFFGTIGGATAVEIVANSTFYGANTYTGATFIDAGRFLEIRDGGAVQGAIVNGGTLSTEYSSGVLTLGAISGSGAVQQTGAGTLVLNQADSYAGGTTITAGKVSIGDGAALGTGAVSLSNAALDSTVGLTLNNALTLTNNATLAAAAGATFTISGSSLTFDASAGSLNLTFGDAVNTGTVVLNATNETVNFANPIHITVAGGTLRAGDDSLSLVAGNATDFTIDSGATLDLGGNNLNTVSLTSSGTITNSSATAATLVMTANNFISGPVTGNLALWAYNGTSILSGADTYTGGTKIYAAATLQLGVGSTVGSIVGNIDDEGLLKVVDDFPVALTGVISGAGSLVAYGVDGSGAITLGGANTYAGGTTLNNGSLILGGGKALGTGNVTLNGGELLATKTMGLAATQNGANTFTLSGDNTIAAAHGTVLNLGGAQIQVEAGAIDIGEGANDGTVVFTGGSGSAPGPFAINVNAGTLKSGDITFGNLTSFATGMTVAAGATWDLAGFTGTANTLTGAGAITNTSKTKAVVFDLGGQFNGVISGKIELSAGDATLTGANSFTGGTDIQIGRTLTLGDGGTTGSITGSIFSLGALAIDRSNAVALANVISGTGSLIQEGTGVTTVSGANSYTGGTTVTAGELIAVNAKALGKGGTLTVTGAELLSTVTATLSGDLHAGAATIAAAHGATLTLNDTNAMIDAGTLKFGQGANNGTIVFKASNGVSFTDSANTFVEVKASLLKQGDAGLSGLLGGATGTKIDAGASVDAGGLTLDINSLTGTGGLTNSGAATLLTVFGSTNFGGAISGKFSTIDVFGAASLSGNETFTGTAQIDGGSLTLSGTFAEAVAFNGGGTLALTNPANFTGAIRNFASGVFVDLADITTGAAATLGYDKATHTLTVSDGAHTDHLTFIGAYKQANFVATADGAGGTTIGWQAAPATPGAFAQAMAGLESGAAGPGLIAHDASSSHPAMIAIPR